jgi:hypothetical protein
MAAIRNFDMGEIFASENVYDNLFRKMFVFCWCLIIVL